MPEHQRPLSPHLQVYRPQLTSVLSISHRATGMLLALGTLGLVYWLVALASGPAAFRGAQSHFAAWYGQALLVVWSFALFYHLCNGIRHLFWDAGYGFELRQVYASGWVVVIVSVLLTVAVWAFVITSGSS